MLILFTLMVASVSAVESGSSHPTATDFLDNPKLRPNPVKRSGGDRPLVTCTDRRGKRLVSGDAEYEACLSEASTRKGHQRANTPQGESEIGTSWGPSD